MKKEWIIWQYHTPASCYHTLMNSQDQTLMQSVLRSYIMWPEKIHSIDLNRYYTPIYTITLQRMSSLPSDMYEKPFYCLH